MDLINTLRELIDLRSFSNLWYWIALAVVWSTASHFVLGIPYDIVQRARRQGGQAQADLDTLAGVNSRRITYIASVSGLWLTGFGAAMLTTLAILSFHYWIEFAQAVFFIALPLTLVGVLSIRCAQAIVARQETGEALRKRLLRHRLNIQLVGMIAIFVTALFGMWRNLSVGALGG